MISERVKRGVTFDELRIDDERRKGKKVHEAVVSPPQVHIVLCIILHCMARHGKSQNGVD